MRLESIYISIYTVSIFFIPILPSASKEYNQKGFNVYCTSNHDSTGICIIDKSNDSLDCIIIPGQVIHCEDKRKNQFECLLVAQISQDQAEFYCEADNNSLNSNPLEKAPATMVDTSFPNYEEAFK